MWQPVPSPFGTGGARSRAWRVNASSASPQPLARALPGPEPRPAPGPANNSAYCVPAAPRAHPAAAAGWEGAAGG